MSEIGINQTWSTGSSNTATTGALGNVVQVWAPIQESVFYIATGPTCSGVFSLQSAMESTGPFFDEGSTTVNTGAMGVMRFTGPFGFVRPFSSNVTSGAYHITLLGTM